MDSSGSSIQSARNPESGCVQVALRIRPQGNRERLEGSRVCTSVLPNDPQVSIGGDRSFTYDNVFDRDSEQHSIYDACINRLVEGLFEGYNATVLAYGQTGSGKTYTMGTAFDAGPAKEEEVGVIPRAIDHVFRRIMDFKRDALEKGILEPTFEVSVQFIELYNEEILDLLTDDRSAVGVRIHEDNKGEIVLHGVTAKNVTDMHSTLEILKNGALNRTVASTNMNEQSSRSHAIFSLHIKQQRMASAQEGQGQPEVELLQAKFHFVDLAGSERLKRTGATGDRAKEGISINCGLLALGNVISSLGGANGKVSHVPYRDSKLTRLLQDSLGGNSRTLMIACVSPSDSDFVETLNTMKYANRAKNIKNKVVANQDKSSKLIGELRSRIAALENELVEFKQGRRTVGMDGLEVVSDQYHENVLLQSEVNNLRFRVKALTETNEILRNRNVSLMAEKDSAIFGASNGSTMNTVDSETGEALDPMQAAVRKYLEELERIRSQLYEAQATSDQLRKELNRWKSQAMSGGGIDMSMNSSLSMMQSPNKSLIDEARAEIERLRQAVRAENEGSTSDYVSHAEEEDGTSNEADELEVDEDGDVEMDTLDDEDDDDPNELSRFEENQECSTIRDNLNDIQQEISIKERLIMELEKSERRMAEVRLQYEKKLNELTERIRKTEEERDRMVSDSNVKNLDKASQEKAKAIRDEYERKLSDMRSEFRKLKMLEREHERMQVKEQREREQRQKMMRDLADLKKGKVDLVKRLNEEVKKARQVQLANSKKVATMDKESRKKDNTIRQLQNKDRQRETFLAKTSQDLAKLRQAEKDRLRKERELARSGRSQAGARTPAGRGPRSVAGRGKPPPEITFNPRMAAVKWKRIEKKMARQVAQRDTAGMMEEELNRFIAERHRCTDELIALERRFLATQDVTERNSIAELVEENQAKMRYIESQIEESQAALVSLEDKDDKDEDLSSACTVEQMLENCDNVVEARYLMMRLFGRGMETAVAAQRHETRIKELEAQVQQMHQQSVNDQFLLTVIEDRNLANDVESLLENKRKSRSPSVLSLRLGNTSPSLLQSEREVLPYKARRHTATHEDMLYPSNETESVAPPSNDNRSILRSEAYGDVEDNSSTIESSRKERRKVVPLGPSASATHPPASTFIRNSLQRNTVGGLPPRNPRPPPNMGLAARRGGLRGVGSMSRLPVVEEATPPSTSTQKLSANNTPGAGSQNTRRRNVFRRLASWTEVVFSRQGRVVAAKSNDSHKVVSRTHTMEGHSKAVLALDATDQLLITGSKDRTSKLWDLAGMKELCTLGVHVNNVHTVRFIPQSQLAFSVSMYQIRIWDLRTHECVRILQSSGQVIEGDGGSVESRQNTVPFLETVVQAAEVDPDGRLLFTSFSGDVRIWDLQKWGSFGRLTGATQSPRSEVVCMNVVNGPNGCDRVFTGSRDHYVKMYDIRKGGEGLHEPQAALDPPHYDNVTCVVSSDTHLYSAGKDANIMKFNLLDFKRDHLELKAHGNYIQGMCFIGKPLSGGLLATACKEGTVKFWDTNSTRRMRLVEEISKAHDESINAVTANTTHLFTASSDHTVGIWKQNFPT